MKRKIKQTIRGSACKKRGCSFKGFDLMRGRTFETIKRQSK